MKTIEKQCKLCGKTFNAPLWRETTKAKLGPQKFCNKTCASRGGRAVDPKVRAMQKVKHEGTCWLWQGEITNEGYGRLWVNRKMQSAHRLMYEWNKGKLQPGQLVMHTCDNTACVNPDHLLAGTLSQNSQDMLHKGRSGNAKLKPTQVRNIADRVRDKEPKWALYKPIAKEFGVSEAVIYHIHVGRTWHKVSGLPKLKLSGKNDFCIPKDKQ